jgi:hypothetical protein
MCAPRGCTRLCYPRGHDGTSDMEGGEIMAKKFNDVVTVNLNSLDLTDNLFAAIMDNKKVMIATSNCYRSSTQEHLPLLPSVSCIQSIAATAQEKFGHPPQEYLNGITITTNQIIADMGAASIFIMDGNDVVNKRLSWKPLRINMPNRRKSHLHMYAT